MHASDPVNRIMMTPVLTIAPSESREEALRLFTSYPVHHLPVVEDERVVGMLSSADVVKVKFFLPPPGQHEMRCSRSAGRSERLCARLP
jgi:CBS domain-containing membrane protein